MKGFSVLFGKKAIFPRFILKHDSSAEGRVYTGDKWRWRVQFYAS
jgi:hypothetical protein